MEKEKNIVHTLITMYEHRNDKEATQLGLCYWLTVLPRVWWLKKHIKLLSKSIH